MSSPILRRTVDLSGFPDLVVIYLGMRVNRWTGLKTLFGFGPQIAQSVEARPDGLLLHENLVWSLFLRMSGCGSIGGTLTHSSVGHVPIPTGGGGNTFSAIPAARDFGTKPIACAAGWRRCTTTSCRRSGSCGLLRYRRPKARCLPPEVGRDER